MASGFSLKDQLYNAEKVQYLADLFGAASTDFDVDQFTSDVMERLLDLELKERIAWICECLCRHLPGALPDVQETLLKALPPPLDPGLSDDDFGDFIFAPLGEFVVAKGLEEHAALGLDLLHAITQRFSMEWAIRPFLNRWPEETMARLVQWSEDPNYHVRRLASEGTRPRLPWGEAVGLALADPLPLLDQLHRDKTRYVTRSVANHLNDISKKKPDLVLERLRKWRDLGVQTPKELDWMTAHALRGLVKEGHGAALQMLGYDPEVPVVAKLHLETTSVAIGEALNFHCELEADQALPVLVDYRLHFQRPSGKTSVKVFKLKQAKISKGALTVKKSHKFKSGASTFTLVPGAHHIELMVNGVVRAEAHFDLTEAS
ncbi:3-methyladenine DNA glycosylase AlkC [Epibacterium ulvae]|uniref:3-methyladenine DNA glycosylase AlkC n=1 Tax=Epibacterium ulvae TaxID=1156985 RepID=A0A1G5QNY1_9RHOB|nr:hypothetical protein [Epibacterium ulvae]SCZ63447.1 3-methyladenine DNA glycosylase AlkC [Epibacterium ulvae]